MRGMMGEIRHSFNIFDFFGSESINVSKEKFEEKVYHVRSELTAQLMSLSEDYSKVLEYTTYLNVDLGGLSTEFVKVSTHLQDSILTAIRYVGRIEFTDVKATSGLRRANKGKRE